MRPRRAGVWSLVALVLGVVASACANDQQATPQWVEEVQAEGERSRVSLDPSSAPTSVDEADTPPDPEVTGEDFDQIWREIEAFESWLLAHPDQSHRLEAIYVPGRELHRQTSELLADLTARNAAMVVEGYEIQDVTVRDRTGPDTAVIRYRDSREYRELVDRTTGEVLEREEYENQPWTWDLTLERSDDGVWRIADIVFVEEASG